MNMFKVQIGASVAVYIVIDCSIYFFYSLSTCTIQLGTLVGSGDYSRDCMRRLEI